jgi:hypothetical protein
VWPWLRAAERADRRSFRLARAQINADLRAASVAKRREEAIASAEEVQALLAELSKDATSSRQPATATNAKLIEQDRPDRDLLAALARRAEAPEGGRWTPAQISWARKTMAMVLENGMRLTEGQRTRAREIRDEDALADATSRARRPPPGNVQQGSFVPVQRKGSRRS